MLAAESALMRRPGHRGVAMSVTSGGDSDAATISFRGAAF